MSTTSSYMAITKFSMIGWASKHKTEHKKRSRFTIFAQEVQVEEPQEVKIGGEEKEQGKVRQPKVSGATGECEEQEHEQRVWRAVAQQHHLPRQNLRRLHRPRDLCV